MMPSYASKTTYFSYRSDFAFWSIYTVYKRKPISITL